MARAAVALLSAGLWSKIAQAEVIGILGSSGGDVEACSEVESFTKYFVKEGLLHSAPSLVGQAVAELIWHDMAKELQAEYEALPGCNTSFRQRSSAQSSAFAQAAQKRRLESGHSDDTVLPYTAWKFNHGAGHPANLTIEPALERARLAGVSTFFMWDQDAIISSVVLNGVSYDIAKKYIAQFPEWNPTVYGINGLNTQPGFMDRMLMPRLKLELEEAFPGASPSDVCILAVGQGVPTFSELVDPYAKVLTELSVEVGKELKQQGYEFHFAWQNWAGKTEKFPLNLLPWTEPYDVDVLNKTIAKAPCSKVLVTDALQWPVSDVSTLVREGIYFAEWMKELAPEKQFVAHKSWDSWAPLSDFIGELVHGVLSGTGGFNFTLVVGKKELRTVLV